MQDDQEYTLVTVKRSRGGVVERERKKGGEIAVKSQFEVKAGDFLISKRQIVHGACGMVPESLDGATVSNEYAVLRCTDKLLPEFLNYLVHTIYFQQTCFHSSIGVHVEKMIFKLHEWFRWEIDLPDIEEQHRIAAFFVEVNAKSSLLSRKRELFQGYKRGLMQKIFSQEIRVSSKSDAEFPQAINGMLGDMIVSMDAGVSVNSGDVSASRGLQGVLKTSAISGGKFDASANKVVSEKEEIRRLKESVQKGTILMSRMNTPSLVGDSALVSKDSPNLFLPDRLWALKIKGVFSSCWVSMLLQTKKVRDQLSARATGTSGSMKNISKGDVLTIPVTYPPLVEQQKIANFLTAIDHKIDAVSQQIEQMESFKRGLLQKMFV